MSKHNLAPIEIRDKTFVWYNERWDSLLLDLTTIKFSKMQLLKCIASIKAVIVLSLFYEDVMMLQLWKQQDLNFGSWSCSSYHPLCCFLENDWFSLQRWIRKHQEIIPAWKHLIRKTISYFIQWKLKSLNGIREGAGGKGNEQIERKPN